MIVSLLILVAGNFPNFVEKYYSTGFYLVLSSILRFFSGLFSFAIGDFLYGFVGLYFLFYLFKLFKNNKLNRYILNKLLLELLNTVLIVYVVFKMFWALNYNREPVHVSLNLDKDFYNEKQLLKLANFLLFRLDSIDNQMKKDNVKFDLTQQQIFTKSYNSYTSLSKLYPYYNYTLPSVKSVIFPKIISKMGVEGYYNPLSGEANVNTLLPQFVLPFVTCHEIAHQIGIAREDEANFLGYISCIHSEDIRFQFSSVYNMFRSVLLEVRLKYPERYNELRSKIPKNIEDKFQIERAFWLKYNSMMSVYMTATFDKILKLNSQEKGIDSYQDVVIWLYNYHKKDLVDYKN